MSLEPGRAAAIPGSRRAPRGRRKPPRGHRKLPRGSAGARTPRRDPGWGGRDSGSPGAGGSGRDPGPPARRGGDPGADVQTRRMPAQPGAGGSPRARPTRTQPTGPQPSGTQPSGTQPSGTQPNATRSAVTQPRGMRGAALGPGGPRDSRGRKYPPRPRGQGRPRRWGALQGGLGVCIIVASAAIGAIVTMAARSAPGVELGLFVVAGTVAAALAVRPRAGRMIFPVPILSYLVAALISGIVFDRTADSSSTALAVAAAQWVANGFFAMALATVLAVAIIAARWYLWRRGRPASRGARPAPPASTARTGPNRAVPNRAVTTRAAPNRADPNRADPNRAGATREGATRAARPPRAGWEAAAEPGYPAGFAGPGSPRPGGEADGPGGPRGSRGLGRSGLARYRPPAGPASRRRTLQLLQRGVTEH